VSKNVLRTLSPQRWTWRRLQTINSKSQALRATLQLRGDSDDNPVVSPAERVNKRKLTLNSQICPPIKFEVHDPQKLTYQHKLDIYLAIKENCNDCKLFSVDGITMTGGQLIKCLEGDDLFERIINAFIKCLKYDSAVKFMTN